MVQRRSPSFTGSRLVLFHILHRNRNTGQSDNWTFANSVNTRSCQTRGRPGMQLILPPPPVLGSWGDGESRWCSSLSPTTIIVAKRSTFTRTHHLHHLMPLSIHQHMSATITFISRASLKIQSHSPPVQLSWSLRLDATLTDIVARSNEGTATPAIAP